MALRPVLRAPCALRPPRPSYASAGLQVSQYHSYEHPAPPPYPEPANSILASTLTHVPAKGFTHEALVLGARDRGYLDISTNLFPKGPFSIVQYYLTTQRLALKDRIQFPPAPHDLPLDDKIKSLILTRLRANTTCHILPHLPSALALMSLAENLPASLQELALLSDEILFLAGDKAVDASWYTRRAAVSGVYAATEMFQTRDTSEGLQETEAFLGRRWEEVSGAGRFVSGLREWVRWEMGTVVNWGRSKGVRI